MPSAAQGLMWAAWIVAGTAALHVGIVIGGPSWYRFFGAGERMARDAQLGHAYPALVTLAIAGVLGVWAAYGLSVLV